MGGHSEVTNRPAPTQAELDADHEADKSFNRFARWRYGLAVMVAGHALAIGMCYALATHVLGQTYEPEFASANAPVAAFLVGYFALLLGVRYPEGGTFVFYEMLWGCNTSMVLTVAGIVLGRPMLVCAAITTVGIDQLCWYVDLTGYLLFRRFVVGAAKYMVKPDCSYTTRVTSLHHIWFLPLCFWTVRDFGFIRPNSLVLAAALTTFLAIWCRALTPEKVPISRKEQRRLGQPHRLLNVNCAFGFWADVPIPFLHWYDHAPAPVYLAYLSVVGNAFLNALPYALFRALSPK